MRIPGMLRELWIGGGSVEIKAPFSKIRNRSRAGPGAAGEPKACGL
jgi:hypothetical protein